MTSQTPDMLAVLERLDKLERQNRRLRRAGALALAVVGALVLMAQTRPRNHAVKAGEFDLLDADGRVRAKLGFMASSPALELYDKNRFAVATLYAYLGSTGGLLLNDQGSGADISLMTTALVGPELRFIDSRGNLRAALSMWNHTGDVTLELADAKGFRSVLGAVPTADTIPRETDQTSAAALRMFDKDGKVIWRAPTR